MVSLNMEMSRLTRDGTAEPVPREVKFSGTNADREILIFPVQLTIKLCRIGNLTRLIRTLGICVTILRYTALATEETIIR